MDGGASRGALAVFAGQGARWDREYAYLAAEGVPAAKAFLEACTTGVMSAAAASRPDLYPHGVDISLAAAAMDGDALVGYCQQAPMSVPFVFITQVAAYLDGASQRGPLVACAGHSQGLAAALLVGAVPEAHGGAAFTALALELLELLVALGMALADDAKAQHTAMVSVLKLPAEEVEAYVQEAAAAGGGDLRVTLKNDLNAVAVGGTEEACVSFVEFLKARLPPEAYKAARLPVPCVFHHDLYLDGVFEACAAWLEKRRAAGSRAAYRLRGGALGVCVQDGARDLRDHDGDLFEYFIASCCTRVVAWRDTVSAVVRGMPAEHAVHSYGPGTGVLDLTKRILGDVQAKDGSDSAASWIAPCHLHRQMAVLAAADGEPLSAEEAALAALWSAVLDVPEALLRRESNFFEMGGTSLGALEIISRLRAATGVHLPMNEFFEGPTVRAMAGNLSSRQRGSGADYAPPLTCVDRASRPDGWFPASYGEEQMLVLMDSAPTAYNMPFALSLVGPGIAPDAVREAMHCIVSRHEALRTVLRWAASGHMEQKVMPDDGAMLEWSLIDAKGATLEAKRRDAREVMCAEGNRVFDLHRGPITRASLIRVADAEWVFVGCIHHHVSDGWTIVNLRREVLTAVDAAARGVAPMYPELPVQYVDWTCWHRGWLEGDRNARLEKELSYWRRELANPPVLDLFPDKARPAKLTDRGGTVGVHIPSCIIHQLKSMCRRTGCTLFMALVGLYGLALTRHANQTEVVIGFAIAGRDQPGMENLIGYFANEVGLRVDCGEGPSFLELLQRVREKVLNAYANQHVPFHKVVEALKIPRDSRRTAVYQAMFALQENAWHELDVEMQSGVAASIERYETHSSKFEIHLQFRERKDGGIDGDLHYASDLFERSTALRFARHLEVLAGEIAAHPHRPVDALNMLTAEELEEYTLWNTTDADFGPTRRVESLWAERVASTPAAEALCFEASVMTFAEVDAAAKARAGKLAARGVIPGERVALMLERGTDQVVAMLAVLKLRAAFVPIDVKHTPPARAQFILQDAGVTHIVAHDKFTAYLADVAAAAEVLYVSSLEMVEPVTGADPGQDHDHDHDEEDAVFSVLYTSGTTGLPKGAVILHRNVVNLAVGFSKFYNINGADRLLQFSSFSFVMSLRQIWPTLIGGGCLVLLSDPLEFGQAVNRHGVTKLVITASALGVLDPAQHPSIKAIQFGGEKVPLKLVQAWASRGVELKVGLGPTELTGHAMCNANVTADVSRVTIGTPHDNVRCYITNGDAMKLNPAGVVGELCIAGNNVCAGYLNRTDLTAKHFVPNPFLSRATGEMLYRTGDLAVRLADGHVLFMGRRDDQVKIHGYRIELQEIQTVLETHPEVAAAAVAVHEDKLCGYVAPASVDATALRRYIAERVAHYMVPWAITALEAMPLNKNGKLDRAALPRPESHGGAGDEEQLPLITDTQRRVADVWQAVLALPGGQALHRSDNFFDVGGSSLTAALMVRRLGEAGVGDVPVLLLFENQTIAELAGAIDEQKELAGGGCPDYWEALDEEEGDGFTADEACFGTCGYGVLQGLLVFLVLVVNVAPLVLLALSFYFITREFEVHIAMCILPWCLFGYAAASGALIVCAKWLVVGKLRPGRYPLAGATYLRWWFNGKLGAAAAMWSWGLNETPLLPAWYRLLGAAIGAAAHLDHAVLFEPDLVTIGDGFVGGFECALSTSEVVDGYLVLREVVVGDLVRFGIRAVALPGSRVPDNVDIANSSAVSPRAAIGAGERWSGSPAKRAGDTMFTTQQVPAVTKTWWYKTLLLPAALYVLLYLLQVPFVCLATIATRIAWRWGLPYSTAFLAMVGPVVLALGYMLVLVAAKWWMFLGRVAPGVVHQGAWFLLRRWVVDRLLLNPLYLTFVLVVLDCSFSGPWLYRLLGVRIGGGQSWMSTPLLRVGLDVVSFGTAPHMGQESCFFSDVVTDAGVEFVPITIGDGVTFGQHTSVQGGVTIGNGCTVGANTLLPHGFACKAKCTVVGAPPVTFELSMSAHALAEETQAVVKGLRGESTAVDVGEEGVEEGDGGVPAWQFWLFTSGMLLCQLAIPAAMAAAWVGVFFVWGDIVFGALYLESRFYLLLIMPCVLGTVVLGVLLFMWVLNALGAFHASSGQTRYFSLRFFRWYLCSSMLFTWNNKVMSVFGGTRIYTAFLWSMGAAVGRGVVVDVRVGGFREVDHLQLEDGAMLFTKNVHAHYIDHGRLQFAPVRIGRGVCINEGAFVMALTQYEPRSALRPYAVTTKGQIIPEAAVAQGNPAISAYKGHSTGVTNAPF